MGVLGVILSFVILRYALRIDRHHEEDAAKMGAGHLKEMTLHTFSVRLTNKMVAGDTVRQIHEVLKRDFMISRIIHSDGSGKGEVVNGATVVNEGDLLQVVAHPTAVEAIVALVGEKGRGGARDLWQGSDHASHPCDEAGCQRQEHRPMMGIRTSLGTNITRVNRNGVDLIATPHLKLQLGDRVTVVGTELAIAHTEKLLGNQMKRLNAPNLIPIFLGIMLGCIVANIPFFLPGINESLRLGLTGGPLVVAILIGFFGPKYNLVTYNTISANLMLREVGICIFLACVGLGTGAPFVQTLATGEARSGLPMVPPSRWCLFSVGGLIGRYVFHINYYTMLGVLAGAHTNPAALAYVREQTSADAPAVGYATVYPFAMFLRIVTIQILIFVFG